MSASTVRLHFKVTEKDRADLEALANMQGYNMTVAVQRAIQVHAFILEQAAKGNTFYVRDEQGYGTEVLFA